MDYITNYYKNLSEQLQDKLNYLQNLIETLDPVGEEDEDINNDGVVDDTDDYLLNKRKVVGDAINRSEHKKGYKGTKRNPERKLSDAELARMHELEIDRGMHRDYEG